MSMKVAADLCIYTNHNFTMEKLTKKTQEIEGKVEEKNSTLDSDANTTEKKNDEQ